MDVDEFCAIMDRSLIGHERDDASDWEHAQSLREQLAPLPREELVAFHETYWALADRAERADVWGVGYTLDGGMSDDSFLYFRYWLISRGRAVYESVLADPDSLAAVPGLVVHGSHSAEGVAGVAFELHDERYGCGPEHADSSGTTSSWRRACRRLSARGASRRQRRISTGRATRISAIRG
jgi:hypothetical protein